MSDVAHYLGNLTATVNNGGLFKGQQVIAACPYANSISFDCDCDCDGGDGSRPDEAYDVADSSTFTAEAGIPDNMQNATDVVATVTSSNEAGERPANPSRCLPPVPLSSPWPSAT